MLLCQLPTLTIWKTTVTNDKPIPTITVGRCLLLLLLPNLTQKTFRIPPDSFPDKLTRWQVRATHGGDTFDSPFCTATDQRYGWLRSHLCEGKSLTCCSDVWLTCKGKLRYRRGYLYYHVLWAALTCNSVSLSGALPAGILNFFVLCLVATITIKTIRHLLTIIPGAGPSLVTVVSLNVKVSSWLDNVVSSFAIVDTLHDNGVWQHSKVIVNYSCFNGHRIWTLNWCGMLRIPAALSPWNQSDYSRRYPAMLQSIR